MDFPTDPQLTKAEQEMLEIIQHAVATEPMTDEEAHEHLGLDEGFVIETVWTTSYDLSDLEEPQAVFTDEERTAFLRLASTSEVIEDPILEARLAGLVDVINDLPNPDATFGS